MITGFNTDIEHDGVVYHVQTEDKGLESPLILSLVYVGGAILASKRSPYEDLIAEGFDEAVLSERVSKQHRLICAAIKAGRIEELKQMGNRGDKAATAAAEPELVEAPAAPTESDFVIVTSRDEERLETPAWTPEQEQVLLASVDDEPPMPPPTAPRPDAYMVFDSRRKGIEVEEPAEGLCLSLLEEHEFRSGESLRLGVVVTYRSAAAEKPVSGVPVSVKILGTSFRPVIVSVKTQKDGVAMISAEIPRFSSGRAAILLRAVKGEESVEIRRVVRPT